MDFTLVDQALLVLMDKFNGILDGDNMICHTLIDVINHSRQRGTLTRARGSRHQDQALGKRTKFEHRFW